MPISADSSGLPAPEPLPPMQTASVHVDDSVLAGGAISGSSQPISAEAPITLRANYAQGGYLLGQAAHNILTVSYQGQTLPLDAEGRFFVGFDRDADSAQALQFTMEDGRSGSMPFELSYGNWSIQNINAAFTGSARSNAEFERRRSGELAQINEARRKVTDANGWTQRFIWPVKGRVSGHFGRQRVYQGKPGSYHGGIDIAVPTGTEFIAPADGVVILAAQQPFTLEGYLLMIDHGSGLNSAFLHCSQLLVKDGDHVRQGQVIGRVGSTGRATGPHLHWGMKWNSTRIDPYKLLSE